MEEIKDAVAQVKIHELRSALINEKCESHRLLRLVADLEREVRRVRKERDDLLSRVSGCEECPVIKELDQWHYHVDYTWKKVMGSYIEPQMHVNTVLGILERIKGSV